jgi:hypothetical protein
MDYENVYYVDSRNAGPVVVDHRTGQRLPTGRTTAVVSTVPAAAPPAAVSWSQGSTPYQYPAPSYYGPTAIPNSWTGYPVNPPYILPPVSPASNLATILGGFGDLGTLANIAAQAFAAFLPLPVAPTPQDSLDAESQASNAATNSSNLIRYQNALALFARRDQQILTLGSVLKELFKRPGVIG